MKSRPTRWLGAVAAATLFTLAANGQDPLTRKELDKRLDVSLFEATKVGTDLYNRGRNEEGCYREYDGTLRIIVPLLDHRPELQSRVANALKQAAAEPSPQRSFTLRGAIDDVRQTLNPRAAMPSPAPTPPRVPSPAPVPPKVPAPAPAPAAATKALWERLGGETAVKAVVHETVAAAAKNPKVNLTRNGKYKLDDKGTANLERLLVELVSSATGGPLKYSGRDMKTVHAGMKITEAEFNAMAADLNDVLKKHKVGQQEIEDLMKVIESTKKDIVEK
jgi:hemoglobin